jgi:hypothetical protein
MNIAVDLILLSGVLVKKGLNDVGSTKNLICEPFPPPKTKRKASQIVIIGEKMAIKPLDQLFIQFCKKRLSFLKIFSKKPSRFEFPVVFISVGVNLLGRLWI